MVQSHVTFQRCLKGEQRHVKKKTNKQKKKQATQKERASISIKVLHSNDGY